MYKKIRLSYQLRHYRYFESALLYYRYRNSPNDIETNYLCSHCTVQLCFIPYLEHDESLLRVGWRIPGSPIHVAALSIHAGPHLHAGPSPRAKQGRDTATHSAARPVLHAVHLDVIVAGREVAKAAMGSPVTAALEVVLAGGHPAHHRGKVHGHGLPDHLLSHQGWHVPYSRFFGK